MELEEKDFIHEEYSKHPYHLWFWVLVCLVIFGGIWWITRTSEAKVQTVVADKPFLQVTNRDYQMFLWQNPGFMKDHLKANRHYLSAWGDRLAPDPAKADDWVEATPEALFMYHTWKRIVGEYNYPRDIPLKEFLEFLKDDPEWLPQYWSEAPPAYRTLIKWFQEGNTFDNLRELSYKELPLEVRQAFVGWKNYKVESQAINKLSPTWRQLWTFLEVYPNFRRSLWINFLRKERPHYLDQSGAKGEEEIPEDRMDGLLKMALYNYLTRQT